MRAVLPRRWRRVAPDASLGELKLRAIDVAVERLACDSLADLGAVWAVDAGYAFYALERHGLSRVAICDDDFTEAVTRRARDDPRVELIRGNFGTPEVVGRIGAVDLVLMFDVLLHQVKPDWDELLEMYGGRARCLAIAGPCWKGPETVRLLELGREAYLDLVPTPELHRPILDRLDELNQRRGRPWRDCHDIWQWGVTDRDLRARLGGLGFRLAYHENLGPWQGSAHFDNCSHVFVRDPDDVERPPPR